MKFTVLKTEFSVSPLFFAVLTLFLLLDKSGIALFVILFSLLHELGHFLALLCVKTRPVSMRLTPFGIHMKLPLNLSTEKKLAVLIAGFTVNFVLAAVLKIFGKEALAIVNLFMGMFTALPLYATDGGGVLAAVLQEFSPESFEKTAVAVNAVASFSIIFVLLYTAFITENIFLLLPIAYILIMALKK